MDTIILTVWRIDLHMVTNSKSSEYHDEIGDGGNGISFKNRSIFHS